MFSLSGIQRYVTGGSGAGKAISHHVYRGQLRAFIEQGVFLYETGDTDSHRNLTGYSPN